MTWRILAAMRSAASKISCSPRCWSAKSPWAIRRTTRGSLSSNRSRQASRTDAKVRGRKYATASGRRELKTAERSTLALDPSCSHCRETFCESAEEAIRNQSPTSSVLNPRSREVWRKTAGEKEFQTFAVLSQCGGCARSTDLGDFCGLGKSAENAGVKRAEHRLVGETSRLAHRGWRSQRNWNPTFSRQSGVNAMLIDPFRQLFPPPGTCTHKSTITRASGVGSQATSIGDSGSGALPMLSAQTSIAAGRSARSV